METTEKAAIAGDALLSFQNATKEERDEIMSAVLCLGFGPADEDDEEHAEKDAEALLDLLPFVE